MLYFTFSTAIKLRLWNNREISGGPVTFHQLKKEMAREFGWETKKEKRTELEL